MRQTDETNTFINAGTVQLGNASGIPGGSGKAAVFMGTNTTLDLNGFSAVLNGLQAGVGTMATVDGRMLGSAVTLTLGFKRFIRHFQW